MDWHKYNNWFVKPVHVLSPIMPDWSAVWSSGEAEAELHGFLLKGAGWYREGNDTLLVIETGETGSWMGRGAPLFQFFVWNDRDPREELSKIANLPCH